MAEAAVGIAGLVLAIPGIVDLCIEYSEFLRVKYQAARDAKVQQEYEKLRITDRLVTLKMQSSVLEMIGEPELGSSTNTHPARQVARSQNTHSSMMFTVLESACSRLDSGRTFSTNATGPSCHNFPKPDGVRRSKSSPDQHCPACWVGRMQMWSRNA